MKIDRSNYEIWLIDMLDGNLSEKQVEELKSFLEMNPDLKEEFNDVSSVSLKPSESIFLNKANLKKSSGDLPESQFEYLCIGYLENDLSDSQREELMLIVSRDSEKKRTFELIQKTKIIPESIIYEYKNRLIKKTPVQKIVRMSFLGLSAAASVAILIAIFMTVPRNLSNDNFKKDMYAGSNPGGNNSTKPTVNNITKGTIETKVQNRKVAVAEIQKKTTAFPHTDSSFISISDAVPVIISREKELMKVPVFAQVDLKEAAENITLRASNSSLIIPYYDEERSNIGRFIAKNFREIFLKEKSQSDSPLKAYEIAEAGVTGLNKLLGWEMALDEKNDENGDLQSVYFSSKMIKFNTPVKKTEPQP
jgi:hypothetical protein